MSIYTMNKYFRSDIQGLRAVAVLSVFFAHANWSLLSGGFVGVDIFFVISGYVITQLLLKEYIGNQRIVLHAFYARRLQRLLPALVFMLIVTIIAALFLLTPFEQSSQYSGAYSALMWVSNLFFLWFGVDYFGPAANQNLYLHTWSLSIEEQFYLFWPILLMLGLGVFSAQPSLVSKNKLLFVLCLTIVVSILLNVFFSFFADGHVYHSFYMMPARAWQFALGALVACYFFDMFSHKAVNFIEKIDINLLAIIGVVLIAISLISYDNSTAYPGWRVLLPTMGSVLLLFAYRFPSQSGNPAQLSVVSKILSLKPLRWLGDISYSFYLWHWPILLFREHLHALFPNITVLICLGVSLVMATLSYYLIENPIRRYKLLISMPKLALVAGLGLMLSGAFSLHKFEQYSQVLVEASDIQRFSDTAQYSVDAFKIGCVVGPYVSEVKPCIFGNKNASQTAIMVGDSILAQWADIVAEYLSSKDWQLIVLSKAACPMVNRPFYYETIKSIYHGCDEWREQATKEIIARQPDLLIMGNSNGYEFSQLDWQQGTRELLNELVPHIARIKLIAGIPQLPFKGLNCLYQTVRFSETWLSGLLQDSRFDCSSELKTIHPNQWLQEVAAEFPTVDFVDFSTYVCPDNMCLALSADGQAVYIDHAHLTNVFIHSIKDDVTKELFDE